MPGEMSDIDGNAIAHEALRPFIIAGAITLRLTFASIRAARVMIAALYAHHAHKKEVQAFARRYGQNCGFLEIRTELPDGLQAFETKLKKHKIEYSRLPDLQKGDGKTQYLFNMNQLSHLTSMIHEYEETKQKRLVDLKKAYTDHPDFYKASKERLDENMPGVFIITAEDYAKTSVKEGKDTPEFLSLEASAEKEMESRSGIKVISSDEAVQDLFDNRQKKKGRTAEITEYKIREAVPKVLTAEIPVKRRTR